MSETKAAPSGAMVWAGRVLSALPVLAMLMSAGMKLSHQPMVVEGMTKGGYSMGAITGIGAIELLSALLYAIPQTSVLGAILVTGYMGGAINVHVAKGEGFAAALILGMMAWGGLFLRDPRVRELLPLRKNP